LQDVILNHVAQSAGRFVIPAAMLDADLLGHGDLHVIGVPAIPDRLEERICEAECQDILRRLFAEIVIDAIELRFGEALGQSGIQLLGAGQIAAERFLDDDPCPFPVLRQPGGFDQAGHGADESRRDGQVENVLRRAVPGLLEPREPFTQQAIGLGSGEIGIDVGNVCCESVPFRFIKFRPARFLDPVAEIVAILVVAERFAIDADDGEALIEPGIFDEVIDRRDQLPPSQVAAGPEDDERRRLRLVRLRHGCDPPVIEIRGRRQHIGRERAVPLVGPGFCRRTSSISPPSMTGKGPGAGDHAPGHRPGAK
jgi:hypothetical protein